MAYTYTFQIADTDYKALCYVTENPSVYVDDHITDYVRQMKTQMAQQLIKDELAKPGVRNIPADHDSLIMAATIKTARQMTEETTIKMEKLVANPDDPDALNEGTNAEIPD